MVSNRDELKALKKREVILGQKLQLQTVVGLVVLTMISRVVLQTTKLIEEWRTETFKNE